MRILPWLLIGAACCLATSTPTLTPHPYLLGLPEAETPLTGHVPLRLEARSPGRLWPFSASLPTGKAQAHATVYLDGTPLLSENAPFSYDWDTTALSNGKHTLLLRWVDPVNRTDQVLKRVTVTVANAPRSAPVGATNMPPPGSPDANAPAAPIGTNSPENVPAESRPGVGTPTGGDPAIAGASERHVLATLHPQQGKLPLKANAHPLAVQATALSLTGDRLCIGLPDGGVTLYDVRKKQGKTLHLPQPTGKVVAIQSDAQAIYWLTDPNTAPAPTASDAASAPESAEAPPPALRQLFVYRPADQQLTSFYLAEANAFTSTVRIAPWRSGIALFAGSVNGLLDPHSGEIVNLEAQFPADATENLSRFSALSLVTEGSDGLLVRADPHLDEADGAGNTSRLRLALWRWHANAWTPAGSFLSTATDTWRPVPLAMTTRSVCSLENRLGLHVGLNDAAGKPTAVPLPFRDYFQAQKAQVALTEGHLWTTDGTALYHTDLDKLNTDAFLPWNEKGLRIQAVAPDREGIWLATSHDVRRLVLKHPDAKLGYAGLIKFRMGQEAETPPTDKDRQLADQIAKWQGVRYQWGGSSKEGTDCSGFVMAVHEPLGVSLPHGTVALRACDKGPQIRDELQYGDVLVYPGHCAIYIGDGKTAETVDKAVSHASVWYHDEVVVRRFLHASSPKNSH